VSNEAKSLIRGILEIDPRKRLSLNQILNHEWLERIPHDLVIFTESEQMTIKNEFTYNNVRRLN
jgi:serine/threonine protein kinase